MEETKVIYHIDDEDTPYLIKLSVPPDSVTLDDFKNALNRPNYKFFFKSNDADFGVVKEEISDDFVKLPCFEGKVKAWLVSCDGSAHSDNLSTEGKNQNLRSGDNGSNHSKSSKNRDDPDTYLETESVYSGDRLPPLRNFKSFKQTRLGKFGQRNQGIYDTSSSLMSSDLESTSFVDSEDDSTRHRRQRRRRRMPQISRISEDASSFSSMTDSTMSLNIVTVTLQMDSVNFLGISIVGQSNKAGDGGIYVGSIMREGAVAKDGRIEPGDMILEVNGISFEEMSNDEAVMVLRKQVQIPGCITLFCEVVIQYLNSTCVALAPMVMKFLTQSLCCRPWTPRVTKDSKERND